MKATRMDNIAPGNPFLSDSFRMGQYHGTNVCVMFEKHDTDRQPYVIIVDTDTGERIRVTLDASIHTLG